MWHNKASVGVEDQKRILLEKELDCWTLAQGDNVTEEECPRTWDGVLCWPPTGNGTTAYMLCPDYVNGFNLAAHASRQCDSTGHWWVKPDLNTTWTNLTLCLTQSHDEDWYEDVPAAIEAHMPRLRLMYNIGYGVSLVSLILAVIIMIYIKRLHCPRNTIHINMFISFILRATISFVKENALVSSVGFSFDVEYTSTGEVKFIEDGSHWQCKMFFALFNYINGANYMWIFVEGIYLHMLITVAMFSEKSSIKKLVIFGWGAPLLFVIPWVIVRAILDDVLCWNTQNVAAYFWIIRGPIVTVIVINFFIFLNIIRVLFTKLSAFKTSDAKRYRYRKLAKSTLILIPLFGVHYIVFIGVPDSVSVTMELVKLYYEMFFNSFQGFFVGLLFCFLNSEVQVEIRKKWNRFFLKHSGNGFRRRSTRDTMTSFVTRGRGSLASSSAYPLDPNLSNGSVYFKNGKDSYHSNSHSNGSDHSQSDTNRFSNGLIRTKGDSDPCESQPMVTFISNASNGEHKSEEIQPILNNNHGDSVTKDIC